MITIDGGMGGGSIVRIAVGLSAATGQEVHLTNIRANRDTPGLGHQHLAAVRAVKELTDAETEGLNLGSMTLLFDPGEIVERSVRVDIPTAGSVALTLQPMMIAATAADTPLSFRVSGGATAGKWAPTIQYVQNVMLPLLKRYGYEGSVEVERHGFYPQGGAVVEATFDGSDLDTIDCRERDPVETVHGVSWMSQDLARDAVAERQRDAAWRTLQEELPQSVDTSITVETVDTLGTGSAIQLWADVPGVGGSAVGERGVPAEVVGADAGEAMAYALMAGTPVDAHMSDQLIPFLGLAGGRLAVTDFTDHVMTSMVVTEAFTSRPMGMEREAGLVTVG